MNTITKSKTIIDNSSKLIISRIEKFVKKENDYKKRIDELERDNEQLKIELNYKNQIKILTIENEDLKREVNKYKSEIEELNNTMEELETKYNELNKKNDESEKQLKKLTKELKESKKTIKGLKELDGCWLTRQWVCDQVEHSKDTTTSFKDLFNYYSSWVELVYGKHMEVDPIVFKDYIMKYQKVYFGWDEVINGTYTNPKINIIIKDE